MSTLLRRLTIAFCREVADHLSGDATQQHLAAQVHELRDRVVGLRGAVDGLAGRTERMAELQVQHEALLARLARDGAARLSRVDRLESDVEVLAGRVDRIAEANDLYASRVDGLSNDAARRLAHVNDVGREVEALRADASKGARAFAALADFLVRGVPSMALETERAGKDVATWSLTLTVSDAREVMQLLNGPLG